MPNTPTADLAKRLSTSPAARAQFIGDVLGVLAKHGVDVNSADVANSVTAAFHPGNMADTLVITSSHTLGGIGGKIGNVADSVVITSSHTIGGLGRAKSFQ